MSSVNLRYTEPLVRAAVRAFVWRAVIRGFGVSFFALMASLAAFACYLWTCGERGWPLGVVLATLAFVVVTLVSIYVAHFRNTVGRFRRLRVPEARFSYDEEQFTLASELGSSTFPWSAITEVWRCPQFWLILYSKGAFSTLPIDGLSAEAQAFITRKTQPIPADSTP